MKKVLLRWGIAVGCAAAMVLLYLWLNSYSMALPLIDRYKSLANAFTVPGVVLLGVGALVWISTTGFFDGLGYGLQHVKQMLIPGYFKKEKDYFDYKEARREKRKDAPVLHLFATGLVCIALAVLFIVRFYGVYTA